MRIILMLRRVLSVLLVCALLSQGAAAASAFIAPVQHTCHETSSDTVAAGSHHDCCPVDSSTSNECVVHCLNLVALPSSAPCVGASLSTSYERLSTPMTTGRCDVPPIPPPIG